MLDGTPKPDVSIDIDEIADRWGAAEITLQFAAPRGADGFHFLTGAIIGGAVITRDVFSAMVGSKYVATLEGEMDTRWVEDADNAHLLPRSDIAEHGTWWAQ